MAVTVYYILKDWVFCEVLLVFECVSLSHKGRSLAFIIDQTFQEHSLSNQLYGIITDNASNNKIMQSQLAEIFASHHVKQSTEAMKIRCLAHVIQLSVKKLLDSIKGSATNDKTIDH